MRQAVSKMIPTNSDELLLRGGPAAAGMALTFLLGGQSQLMTIFVTLMVMDYLSGLTAAWLAKTISSEESLRGIAKKVGTIGLLVLAHQLDKLTNQGYPVIQTAVYWLLIANEGISITENLAELGVPIPDVVLSALAKVSEYQKPHERPVLPSERGE